jgi:hypothetical protein
LEPILYADLALSEFLELSNNFTLCPQFPLVAIVAHGFEKAVIIGVFAAPQKLLQGRVMVCELPAHYPPLAFASAAKRLADAMQNRYLRPPGGMIKSPDMVGNPFPAAGACSWQ